MFTFCVTMKNHGGYTESTLNGFEPGVKLNYDPGFIRWQRLLTVPGTESRIKAFQNLLEASLRKVDEPTMIVDKGLEIIAED